ncbi:nucleotide diphosphatase [Martiniozyma asiatica (nom. inval.)]|nr:nucleotide diphosphatase [Martiniozyma asiatica]
MSLFPSVKNYHIILSSGSPRRLEILNQFGIYPTVVVSSFEEDLAKCEPVEYVTQTALHKAQDVISNLEIYKPTVVISADTIVSSDGGICEKPQSPEHHLQMLQQFNGSEKVKIYTAVHLFKFNDTDKSKFKHVNFVSETTVKFRQSSAELLQRYVQSPEGKDAAGGFKIQGTGAVLIESIQGDYLNVVGLPSKCAIELEQLCSECQ